MSARILSPSLEPTIIPLNLAGNTALSLRARMVGSSVATVEFVRTTGSSERVIAPFGITATHTSPHTGSETPLAPTNGAFRCTCDSPVHIRYHGRLVCTLAPKTQMSFEVAPEFIHLDEQ